MNLRFNRIWRNRYVNCETNKNEYMKMSGGHEN